MKFCIKKILKFSGIVLSMLLLSCSTAETGKLQLSLDKIEGKRIIYIDGNVIPIQQDKYDFTHALEVGQHQIKVEIFGVDERWNFKAESTFKINAKKITHLTLNLDRFPTEKQKQHFAKEQALLKSSDSTPKDSKRYIDNNDNTVSDKTTKLMWKKCIEGLAGNLCEKGRPIQTSWNRAKDFAKHTQFAGYNDWRLPSYNEFATLIHCSDGKTDIKLNDNGYLSIVNGEQADGKCIGDEYDKPTINQDFFPNTPAKRFWTSSALIDYPIFAWVVHFGFGSMYYDDYGNDNRFRLVRNEQ